MIANRTFLWVLCAMACAMGGADIARADAPSTPTPTPVSATVRNGEIDSSLEPHPGSSVQWGRAVAKVDAPADAVMAVLQNYAGYKDFMPNFQASRVLSQRGSSALVYMQVSVMRGAATIWVELKLKERPVQGTTRTIEATMTKGNVDQFKALWQVTPLDAQHSVVTFQVLVDPDLPLPASFIDGENQKTARKALTALRTNVAARAALAARKTEAAPTSTPTP